MRCFRNPIKMRVSAHFTAFPQRGFAQERIRTSTPLPALDPESSASASSATWAQERISEAEKRNHSARGMDLCQRARRDPLGSPRHLSSCCSLVAEFLQHRYRVVSHPRTCALPHGAVSGPGWLTPWRRSGAIIRPLSGGHADGAAISKTQNLSADDSRREDTWGIYRVLWPTCWLRGS
jgi:hypothetical protein